MQCSRLWLPGRVEAMAHKGKWIDGTEPHDRLTKAARRALRSRLELVWHHLPRAAKGDAADPDPVHQLRVSTRRAWAALECYREVVPPGLDRWVRKQLKRIRKAAGDARDFDVLALRLHGQQPEGDADWQFLLARINECREQARQPVKELWQRLRGKHFRRRIGELVKRVHWRPDGHGSEEPGFAQAARDRMREVADAFFIASSGDLSDLSNLHEFRILGKQLRYAMELYHAAFGPEFRGELYPQIEEVQEKIGVTIDHATAIERYEDWLACWDEPRLAAPLGELLQRQRTALAASRQSFAQWWTDERAKQLQQQFDEALTRPFVERVA
ncbi:MAG TPA: CHAD domain-containing protein [Pirellulales bacterium]|jgi:CHAD domain-containing protein|nr:CHAD domain-containing protein [Pirellulales bacterium]